MNTEPLSLPDSQSSYWLKNKHTTFPELTEDIKCDVVIVGGGIGGLTTALMLKQSGLTVAVLEKNTIASGTTGGTTGKVTTQHGIIYSKLARQFGKDNAQIYATASQKAFDFTAQLIKDQAIDCDWKVADNYVYSANPKKVDQFKQEAEMAASLGLPASYETNLELPFETVGAVKFADQAMFNAAKYTAALAQLVNGDGSYVFEHSNVTGMHHGTPCKISTRQASVTAQYAVIATKVPAGPLVGRVTYAAVEFPLTSYIVAGNYTGNLSGMYISPDKEHYSLLPIETEEGPLLLVGGEAHIPGLRPPKPQQQKLADYAQQQFGMTSVAYRWKAMDYLAYDSMPLVGTLYPWTKNMFYVGAFKKWGLNLSAAAAQIITDLIHEQDNPATKLFDPHRASAPGSIPLALYRGLTH